MGKRTAMVSALVCALLFGIALCANAATRMWLTDLTGTEKSEVNVAPGADFDIMVHLNTDLESWMLGVTVVYDRADKLGLAAAAYDNKISLKNNDVSSFVWTANTSVYLLEMPTVTGGMQYGGVGDNAYGVSAVKSVLFGKAGPFTSANSHICTIHFTNNLALGESYYLRLWDSPNPENGFTSFIQKTDGSYSQDGMEYSLKVAAVPEPGSLVGLLGGLVGLGGMMARRSRRRC